MPDFNQSAKYTKPSSLQIFTTAHRGADKRGSYRAKFLFQGGEEGEQILSPSLSYLFISEIEKLLENFTFWDNRMATHPRHPSLQSLHAHFDKFFFKAPCYTLNNNCYVSTWTTLACLFFMYVNITHTFSTYLYRYIDIYTHDPVIHLVSY